MTGQQSSEAGSETLFVKCLLNILTPAIGSILVEPLETTGSPANLLTAKCDVCRSPQATLAVASSCLSRLAADDNLTEATLEIALCASALAGEALRRLSRPEAPVLLEVAFAALEGRKEFPAIEAMLCESLGLVALDVGDLETAGHFFQTAQERFVEVGDEAGAVRQFLRLAQVAGEERSFGPLQLYFAAAALGLGRFHQSWVLTELAHCFHWYASEQEGWHPSAEERQVVESLDIALLDCGLQLRQQWLLARFSAASGDLPRALREIDLVRTELVTLERRRDLVTSLADHVTWLERAGRFTEAREVEAATAAVAERWSSASSCVTSRLGAIYPKAVERASTLPS